MKKYFILCITLLFISHIIASPKPPKDKSQSKIQVALLLDTSGSMNGLIEQAKGQLWKIVNELATSTKDGHRPQIEIALYQYGNNGISPAKGHIEQISPLTSDLDIISEKLFRLTTDGGEEYCGKVIQTSLDELKWSKKDEDLKMIFIAGNESFAQGPTTIKHPLSMRSKRMS